MIPLLIQGGLTAAQLIKGFSTKNKRPTMPVSDASKEMVDSARLDANTSQRAGRAIADAKIKQTTANTIANTSRNTNDVNKILAATSAAQGLENNAMVQQDLLDIQAQEQGKLRLQGALSQKSAEERRVWDFNKGLKYQQDESQKQQNIGAGISNAMTLGNDYSSYLKMKELGMLGPAGRGMTL